MYFLAKVCCFINNFINSLKLFRVFKEYHIHSLLLVFLKYAVNEMCYLFHLETKPFVFKLFTALEDRSYIQPPKIPPATVEVSFKTVLDL